MVCSQCYRSHIKAHLGAVCNDEKCCFYTGNGGLKLSSSPSKQADDLIKSLVAEEDGTLDFSSSCTLFFRVHYQQSLEQTGFTK